MQLKQMEVVVVWHNLSHAMTVQHLQWIFTAQCSISLISVNTQLVLNSD